MSAGLEGKFNILQQSPHDQTVPLPVRNSTPGLSSPPERTHWVPSRYNIRASTDDGRMVLWNTFRRSMSVFKPEQVPLVRNLLRQRGVTADKEEHGTVGYLVDRGFLIPADSNEYRQVQVAIHQQQYRTDRLELILMSSEDCNFRCKYCYEDFARGTMQPQVREGIKNLVKSRLPQLNYLQVSWFGGEPLYGFPAIEDLGPFFTEIAEENSLGLHCHMTTNGYLLTPDVADKLMEWEIRHFQITIDGLPEHHDQSRPGRDGSPTFDTIYSNLQALSQRDDSFAVTLRVNFDRTNGPHLKRFVEMLESDFQDDSRFILNFYPVGRWGGAEDEKLDVCGTNESAQIRQELRMEARKRGLKLGNIKGVNHLGSEVCYAARPYNYLIGAHGQVMKCTIVLDKEDYNVVGQVHPDGTLELNRDKMALWTEPAFENDTKCQKCVVLPLCQGTHCPLVRIEDDKSPCCGPRMGAKQGLRELVQHPTKEPRKVAVQPLSAAS